MAFQKYKKKQKISQHVIRVAKRNFKQKLAKNVKIGIGSGMFKIFSLVKTELK